MSSSLISMGTALIYLQSGSKDYLKCNLRAVLCSFSVNRVKNIILRAVTLVNKKTYIKPMLTFWPF